MTTLDIVTFFVYLVGSVTFILGLKFLASPVSARRGNRLAAAGMALVVGWVFVTEFLLRDGGLSTVWILAVGIPVGALVGALGARRVPMTAMPQMVAIFNGAGGGAAALVAAAEFLRDAAIRRRAAAGHLHGRHPARRRHRLGLAHRLGHRLRQAAGDRLRAPGHLPRRQDRHRRCCWPGSWSWAWC